MPESLHPIQESTVYAISERLHDKEFVLNDLMADLVEQQPHLIRLLKTYAEHNGLPGEDQKILYTGALLTYKAIEAQETAAAFEQQMNDEA